MEFSRNTYKEFAKNDLHSQLFVDTTLEYALNLTDNGLPVIFSTKHFSVILGLEFKTLKGIIGMRNNLYHFYQINKKRGGKRQIAVPHKKLKHIQQWIKINILDKIKYSEYANAYIKERSILTNALNHINSEIILNIDLTKFFETINENRIYAIFKRLGYHTNLAVDFAKICTCLIPPTYFKTFNTLERSLFKNIFEKKIAVLPQGAPTSPALSNLVCENLDKRLNGLAMVQNVNFSRYADDLTFSGKKNDIPRLSIIKKIIQQENFYINWKKVKRYKSGQRQMVTGLLVNDNKVRIPKKFKKEIYRHLHFCSKYGAKQHFDYLKNYHGIDKGFQKEWLFGKICYVKAIEPEEASKMIGIFNKIEWWI